MDASCGQGKVRLAVYDFDGTVISGNSPVLLVRHLIAERKLTFPNSLRIGAWALAYKLSLPQNESYARQVVFTAFRGMPKDVADDYLAGFYDAHIDKRFRAEAVQSMLHDAKEGCVVMVVSATFEAIVDQARKTRPFEYQVSTRMRVGEDGCYTNQVDGLCIEGQAKVGALERFADGKFGAGNWVLERAYGDHHSDLPLLCAAQHPYAVTPDNPLKRHARRRGWPVLTWGVAREDASRVS